jgi:hypothetical protein
VRVAEPEPVLPVTAAAEVGWGGLHEPTESGDACVLLAGLDGDPHCLNDGTSETWIGVALAGRSYGAAIAATTAPRATNDPRAATSAILEVRFIKEVLPSSRPERRVPPQRRLQLPPDRSTNAQGNVMHIFSG